MKVSLFLLKMNYHLLIENRFQEYKIMDVRLIKGVIKKLTSFLFHMSLTQIDY